MPDESAHKKAGGLEGSVYYNDKNVLWDISGWFFKPGGLLYVWSYKAGTTVTLLHCYTVTLFILLL